MTLVSVLMLSPTIFINYRLYKMEERDKNSKERKIFWAVTTHGRLVRKVPVIEQNYIGVA
jgi:hypothetical protein